MDSEPAVGDTTTLTHFLGLDEPIASRLDELLGPSALDVPLNEPIAPHLDELLGPAGMSGTQSV